MAALTPPPGMRRQQVEARADPLPAAGSDPSQQHVVGQPECCRLRSAEHRVLLLGQPVQRIEPDPSWI